MLSENAHPGPCLPAAAVLAGATADGQETSASVPADGALVWDRCHHRPVSQHSPLTKAIIDLVHIDFVKAKADHADVA